MKKRIFTKLQNPQNSVFRTSSIYLAAYLYSLGFHFLGTEDTGTQYQTILFDHIPELDQALADFNANKPIPVLSFTDSYKQLKGMVFKRRK